MRALDARSSAEALAAAARLRSGLSDAAALPADAATRLGDVFLEIEVEVALDGLEAFLGRETRMATPSPPGAAVTSTVFSLARPVEGAEGVRKRRKKDELKGKKKVKRRPLPLLCDRVFFSNQECALRK